MIKLKVQQLLDNSGKTRYWLVKQMNTDYNSVNKICDNLVSAIYLETIDKLCSIFECQPNDIFEVIK